MKKTPNWEKKIEEIVENLYVLRGYSVVKWAGGKELKEVTIVKSFIRSLLDKQKKEIIKEVEKLSSGMSVADGFVNAKTYKLIYKDDVINIIKKV